VSGEEAKNYPLKLLDDRELEDISDDRLNRKLFVDIIKEVILTETNINTIGILGDWGQGKTSVMKFIQNQLKAEPEKKVISVWFDSWKYEKEESLFIPLLATIYKEVSKTWDSSLRKTYETLIKDAFVITKALTGFALSVLTQGRMDIEKLEQYEKQYLEKGKNLITTIDQYTSVIESLTTGFEEFIKKVCEKQKAEKLVIFIDDLDRCLPERVVDFLEKLKVFFKAKNCIYVLAIDPKVIIQAIKQKYPSIRDEDCFEYINKIINLPLKLPEVQGQFYDKFLEHIESQGINLELDRNRIQGCIVNARLHNPRKLKKALNNYIFIKWLRDRKVLGERKDIEEVDNNQLCIFCFWYEFFRKELQYFLDNRDAYRAICFLFARDVFGNYGQIVRNVRRLQFVSAINSGAGSVFIESDRDINGRMLKEEEKRHFRREAPCDNQLKDILLNEPLMYLIEYSKIDTVDKLTRLIELTLVMQTPFDEAK